jgi:DNA topoisomerase-3
MPACLLKYLNAQLPKCSYLSLLKVNSGRRLVPTALGTTLIRGYQCIDADLCLPDIRSFIEQQITLIAKGKADHLRVVQHVLQQFMRKYSYFVKKVVYCVNNL